MRISQIQDTMMQGMKPNLPQDAEAATTFNYDYPGKEELHRFYDSCLENAKQKNPIEVVEKLAVPVGIPLTFGLGIIGMFAGYDSKLPMVAILCGFATIILKGVLSIRVGKLRREDKDIDFDALHTYIAENKKYGFTGGRRLPYCLMGDTLEQYENEKRSFFNGMLIPCMIFLFFLALFVCYLLTRNNQDLANRIFPIVMGLGFFLIGCVLGVGTLFKPWVKCLQYRRRVNAVCVDVETYSKPGESNADSVRPVYMAVVDGKDYIYFEDIKSNLQESMVGDVFPIYVSRKNPYKFAYTQTSGNIMFGGIFILCFCVLGAVFFILGIMGVLV